MTITQQPREIRSYFLLPYDFLSIILYCAVLHCTVLYLIMVEITANLKAEATPLPN